MFAYLLVCPMVFLAGLVDAMAGGGGLISLPAYFLAGLPVHQAIGTNKLSSSMGTIVATGSYSLKGYIPWKEAILFVPAALAGSYLGAQLALVVSQRLFQLLLLVIIPLSAYFVFRSKSLSEAKEEPVAHKRLIILALAFTIGIYDGFYGPGTGTFLILLLTSLARVSLQKANGICKVINLSTNLAALFVYLQAGVVLIPLGLCAGLFSIAGNYLGARLFEKEASRLIRPVILLVLALFMIRLIWDLFF